MVFFVPVPVPEILPGRKRNFWGNDHPGLFHVRNFPDALAWEMAAGASVQCFVLVRASGGSRTVDVPRKGGGQGESNLPGGGEGGGCECGTDSGFGEGRDPPGGR